MKLFYKSPCKRQVFFTLDMQIFISPEYKEEKEIGEQRRTK
jgi:hypothetical protein